MKQERVKIADLVADDFWQAAWANNRKTAAKLFVAAFNFCKVHTTLGTTPAHGSEVTDGPWTIEKLIEEATANAKLDSRLSRNRQSLRCFVLLLAHWARQ
jgi:hypothetical protein